MFAEDGRCLPVLFGCGEGVGRGDAVSDPGCVLDDLRLSELAAQAADRDAYRVGERVGVLVPGLLEQSFRAERARADPEQRFEHGELFGGEIEPSAVAGGSASERVEFDACGCEGALSGGGFAACERSDAQDELGEVEGLGEVVVGAEREPGDPLEGRAGGGQHQDREYRGGHGPARPRRRG